MNEQDLDRLESLLSAATPRPWAHNGHGEVFSAPGDLVAEFGGWPSDTELPDDANLVTEAVNALPDLVALARRALAAEAERDKWRDAHSRNTSALTLDMNRFQVLLAEAEAERDALQADYDRAAQWIADNHPTTPGQTVEDNHMALLKERDALRSEVERLRRELSGCVMCPHGVCAAACVACA